MRQNQASQDKAEIKGVRINVETLHIAARPRELAMQRLVGTPSSRFEPPTIA